MGSLSDSYPVWVQPRENVICLNCYCVVLYCLIECGLTKEIKLTTLPCLKYLWLSTSGARQTLHTPATDINKSQLTQAGRHHSLMSYYISNTLGCRSIIDKVVVVFVCWQVYFVYFFWNLKRDQTGNLKQRQCGDTTASLLPSPAAIHQGPQLTHS